MPYAERLAVINPTTPEIDIVLTEVVIPALPDANAFYMPGANAQWLDGQEGGNPASIFAENALLYAEAYSASGNDLEGIMVYGVGARDYAIRSAGTCNLNVGQLGWNQSNTYFDNTFMGFAWNQTTATAADITTIVQNLGDYSGGSHSPATLNATTTTNIDFGAELDNGEVVWIWSGPAVGSTEASPVGLFYYNINTAQLDAGGDSRIGALKCLEDGTVSKVGLFSFLDADYRGDGVIHAGITDETEHTFIASAYGATTGATDWRFYWVSCEEQAFPATVFTIERAGFSDASMPAYLGDIFDRGEISSGGPAQYIEMHVCGSELGFIISYAEYNAVSTDWEPKFVLVQKDWSTFQRINITGDALCDTILASAVETTTPENLVEKIALTYDNGVWSLLGGTNSDPLLVQSGSSGSGGGGGDGLEDESVRLRVWGYGLDAHKHIVWRLGPSETLVFDPTTGQWASWASPGRNNWRAHVGQNWIGMSTNTLERGFGSDVVAGDDASGVLWILDPSIGRDDRSTTGDDSFDRVVTGGLSLSGREVAPCGALQLDYSAGNPTQTGATFTLELSDDWGNSWVDCGNNTITADDFSGVVEWRGLGHARAPGRVFRITDNGAAVRVSRADLR